MINLTLSLDQFVCCWIMNHRMSEKIVAKLKIKPTFRNTLGSINLRQRIFRKFFEYFFNFKSLWMIRQGICVSLCKIPCLSQWPAKLLEFPRILGIFPSNYSHSHLQRWFPNSVVSLSGFILNCQLSFDQSTDNEMASEIFFIWPFLLLFPRIDAIVWIFPIL